ncbi:MAG: GAF domain-containing sensor histidine kinase [Anaerolineae bacterium]
MKSMLSAILTMRNGKNWLYLLLKVTMIVAFSLLLFTTYPRTVTNFASVSDLAYPAIIGLVTALIVAIMTLIPSVKKYVPFVVLPADWALIGAYIYFMSPIGDNYLLPVGIMVIIAVSGSMFVGILFGTAHVIGSLVTLFFTYAFRPDVGFDAVLGNTTAYVPIMFFAIVILMISLLWNATLDEANSVDRRKVREEIETVRKRFDDMRDRTSALAEMAARINASLNFDHILDSALDLGRMSIYDNPSARVVSMALLVADEDGTLGIESHRGLQYSEVGQRFPGMRGVIAQALERGEPIIYKGGSDDPELGKLNSFALVKSTLVIPLRANFESFGVLVYGSTARNAINEDHFDTLASIGIQVTVALHNAVLYNDLREEKERILRIEANGRKALVRDLHDIPTQTVSAVAMHLSTITTIADRYPERLQGEVDNIRNMALRATEELRHVMFTIRPLSLESSGLKTALNQLAEKMEKTYKQPMRVQLDDQIESVLDKDAKGSIFYLIEEAANNSRKYAEAKMIQVKGVIQSKEVIIQVRDNGRGFDSSAVDMDYESRGSFGMVNMRERAELIGGTFELYSRPGKGTLVTVRVPIANENINGKAKMIPRKPIRKQYTGPMSPSA